MTACVVDRGDRGLHIYHRLISCKIIKWGGSNQFAESVVRAHIFTTHILIINHTHLKYGDCQLSLHIH
jgi:hypothetical protein